MLPEHTQEQGCDHPGHGEVKVSQQVDPDPGQTAETDLLEDADHGVGLLPRCQGDGLPRPLLVTVHDVTYSLSLQMVVANSVWPPQFLTVSVNALDGWLQAGLLCRREVVTADCAGAGVCACGL